MDPATKIAEVAAAAMAGLKQVYVRGTVAVTDTALAARRAEVTARNKSQLQ